MLGLYEVQLNKRHQECKHEWVWGLTWGAHGVKYCKHCNKLAPIEEYMSEPPHTREQYNVTSNNNIIAHTSFPIKLNDRHKETIETLKPEYKGYLEGLKDGVELEPIFMTKEEHRCYKRDVVCLIVAVACLISWVYMIWKLSPNF